MYSRRLVCAVAIAAFGFGAGIGRSHENIWRTFSDLCDKLSLGPLQQSLFLKASSSLIPYDSKKGLSVPLDVKPNQPNMSNLMRFGFPSYGNIRTFDDYVLSYDRRNRTPFWVFEHLTKEKVTKAPGISRDDSKFIEDNAIHEYFRALNSDYKGSGYDRGHLAAAGNHRWSQTAMDQTFHLSNISPQVGKGFNRGAWNVLEMFVRHLTKEYENVYVCTGPLYLPKFENGKLYVKYEVVGKNHVAVPTHFFKVTVCEAPDGAFDLFSFVMPNKELPEDIDVKNYLVPVDSIERAAGFLIFEKIPQNNYRKINGKAK